MKPVLRMLALLLLALAVSGCVLTKTQATALRADVGPDCAALGTGIGTVSVFAPPAAPEVGAVAGDIQKVLKAAEKDRPAGATVNLRG